MSIFQSFDNVFGGHDFQIDDQHYHTEENIFGGENIYDNGQLVGSTKENIFGGFDIVDGQHQKIASTQENVFNGENVFDVDGQQLGKVGHENYGESFSDMSNSMTHYPMDHSNVDTILGYQDPLAHLGDFVLPMLIL